MDSHKNRTVLRYEKIAIAAMFLLLVFCSCGSGAGEQLISGKKGSSTPALKGSTTITPSGGQDMSDLDFDEKRPKDKTTSNFDSSTLTLAQLEQKFPHGKFWNHYREEDNNPDGCTDTPCTHKPNNPCACNDFLNSTQCVGFVTKLTYDYYGSSIRSWTWENNVDKLKPGDSLMIKNVGLYGSNHPVWVTAVDGDLITFADCNSNSDCVIRWNQTITKTNVKKKSYIVFKAPYKLKEASEPVEASVQHSVDTDYPKDFSAKIRRDMTVFDRNNKSIGNVYLNKREYCTVNEVYTDGRCLVTYKGEKAERQYYAYFADLDPVSVTVSRIKSASDDIGIFIGGTLERCVSVNRIANSLND